jgi:immune inhibitor A
MSDQTLSILSIKGRFRLSVILVTLSMFVALRTALVVGALAPGAETLTTLQQAVIPPRDPLDLAHRLLRVTGVPTATPAKAYRVGDTEQFIAENSDKATQFTVTAQLWYATLHVYMWFQQGFKPDVNAVKQAAETFESRIYPTVHSYFGSEASPGIDNDVHLYILHARGLGGTIAGYFGADSEYPRAIVPDSNEHHIFFMSLEEFGDNINSAYYLSTLAHEFQHMVHNNVDKNEDGWLNEGMSVTSELLNGYPDYGFASQFLAAPQTQLNTWSADNGENGPHYGAAFLFVTYFLQRFGEDALRALVANPDNGLESVASTLRKLNAVDPVTNKPIMVEDLFADWVMANLLKNPKVGDGRFAYPRIPNGLDDVSIEKAVVSAAAQELSASQWGTTYLEVSSKGRYHLNLQCQPTVEVTPANAHDGHWMWWSNRADVSNMRLTRAFDLSGVSKATLSFWLWYAIEKDWDYGYVEVSTDVGATWTALTTQDSVPLGGHNNPYGPGFTGYSGGADEAANATWKQESADLTPYAGKKILVRFEYLTDDAVNETGMLIDDIAIPEINYSTDVESGSDGWTAEGWARIDNVLPQRYLVQMAEYGPTPRVFRLLGPDDGATGSWTVEVGGNVSRLVIAVSGLTEFTTEHAPCQYRLTPADKQ